jgi:EAL domain-containing protein (putative c-di-GMP-specific phosphodiesterase class I)
MVAFLTIATMLDLRHPFFDDREISLVYQPVICPDHWVSDDALVEILTRVKIGTNGDTIDEPTDQFFKRLWTEPEIAIAYDRWVILKVFKNLPRNKHYLVNLSDATLLDPTLGDYLDQFNMAFHLEISERHDGIYEDDAIAQIKALSKRHRLYLDDFGQAGSNLVNLTHLAPYLHGVKIDAQLILNILHDPYKRAVVYGVLRMLDNLKMSLDNLSLSVIAEGVETQAILDELLALRVIAAPGLTLCCQGWLYGQPELLYPPEVPHA